MRYKDCIFIFPTGPITLHKFALSFTIRYLTYQSHAYYFGALLGVVALRIVIRFFIKVMIFT